MAPGHRLLTLGLALCPSLAAAASGGPDRFGYTWADQNEPGVSASLPANTGPGTPINVGADSLSAPIDLGFGFPFYGGSYSRLLLSDNGWLTFDTTTSGSFPAPARLPAPALPQSLIAWYWRDLEAPASVLVYPIAGGKMLWIRTRVRGGTKEIAVAVALYQSGRIKLVYSTVDAPATASVGIENPAGDDGLNPWYLGPAASGFALTAGSALEFRPPPRLDCAAATPIACNQTLSSASPAALAWNVLDYPCAPDPLAGDERVFRFVNPTFADVDFALKNVGAGRDLDVLLLAASACNEYRCRAWGDDAIQATLLEPGTYYVVIDGKSSADDGSFDLDVTCTPRGEPIACPLPGTPPLAGMTAGTGLFNGYPCTGRDLGGPESLYRIPFAGPGNLRAVLTPQPGADLDLLAFGPDRLDVPGSCVAWGDSHLTLFNPPPGEYLLAVDGTGATGQADAGAFQLEVSCGVRLDCSAPASDLQCWSVVPGSTAGAANRADMYSCSPDLLAGGEVVYRFHNDILRDVSFRLAGSPDLSLLLVAATCDEGACLKSGRGVLVARDLPRGDYFVIVDGVDPAPSNFQLSTLCGTKVDPASGSWTLSPGQTIHEKKTLWVGGDGVYGDVMLVMDLTASMVKPLSRLPGVADQLLDSISRVVHYDRFGLAGFQDYPARYATCGYDELYGDTTDAPYQRVLPLGPDRGVLALAIQGLVLGNGSDVPESSTRALAEMVDDPAIGWRPQARALVVMMGDALPHSCDADACGVVRQPTGVDPGRDGVAASADDLEIGPTLGRLAAAGIVPLYLEESGIPSRLQQWDCWTRQAGGRAFPAPGGNVTAELLGQIQGFLEQTPFTCRILEARPTPGFENWIRGMTGPFPDVTLPARQVFDFDLGPPPGLAPGTYSFQVDFFCDGYKLASQDVAVTIPVPCTDPPGAVGNRLRALRQGGDVALDWAMGALTPKRYNVHRASAATGIDPPVGAALSPVNGAESFLDGGGVGTSGAAFYEVYGRDCRDRTIYR